MGSTPPLSRPGKSLPEEATEMEKLSEMQELIRDLERVLGHGTVAEDARNQMQTELNNLKKDADGRKNKLLREAIEDLLQIKDFTSNPLLSRIFDGILIILKNPTKDSNTILIESLIKGRNAGPHGATGKNLPPGVLFKVRVEQSYFAIEPDELSIDKDDIVFVLDKGTLQKEEEKEGWLFGRNETNGQEGIFPSSFTVLIDW